MKEAKIIVLAGQSNAVGVGYVKYLPKHFTAEKIAEYYKGYSNIKINYFSHDKKSNGFVDTTIGCTEKSKQTIGPELGMAEWFHEHYPGEKIYIVKCAFGGMSLFRDWISPSGKGDYDQNAFADQKENIIDAIGKGEAVRCGWSYNELVKLLQESIQTLEGQGYAPKIKGFCWMQGESDALAKEHALAYEKRYDGLIRDFNRVFSEYLDNCVYVDAGINDIWAYHHEINSAKEALSKAYKNHFYIDTVASGLTTSHEPEEAVDIYHYDSDSVIKLGKLFAEKIIL